MVSTSKERILTGLSTGRENTLSFFSALTPDTWQEEVYSEGASWTVHEILKHLVSAERAIARLVEIILEGGEGVPVDFDLDRYNESKVQKIGERSPEQLFTDFSEARAATIRLVENMKETDLKREGRHPFLGIAPIEDILKLMYRHAQIHQRDIRRHTKGR